MKKIIVLFLLSMLLTACSISEPESDVRKLDSEMNEKESLSPTQENFLKVLASNKDGKEYLQKYPNTKIINITLIKPEEFESLRNSTEYKELYEDLPQKELYRVDFNGGSQLSLMTIIDLEEQRVIKIFGMYIMGMG